MGSGDDRLRNGRDQLGATATSAADGSFSIALANCPSASAEIYLTAHGGNAGGGSNSSLMMMAALGPCGSISFSTPVIINEVTTAGSVYALSQFLSTTSSGTVGAPSTNATGLADAFANAANLMSVASGSALSTTPGGAGTAPQENLNSIANALGACVQTSGSASANCTELFDCALPGAAFSAGACTGGTGSVADTLAAALSIARNPALRVGCRGKRRGDQSGTVQPRAGIRTKRLVDAAELCPDRVELQRTTRRGDRQLGPRLGDEFQWQYRNRA